MIVACKCGWTELIVDAMPRKSQCMHIKHESKQTRSTRTCSTITGWKVSEATPILCNAHRMLNFQTTSLFDVINLLSRVFISQRRLPKSSFIIVMFVPTHLNLPTFFYPIGNTPATCLTQNLAREERGDILLLGCSDVRKILFTLYSEQNKCTYIDHTGESLKLINYSLQPRHYVL